MDPSLNSERPRQRPPWPPCKDTSLRGCQLVDAGWRGSMRLASVGILVMKIFIVVPSAESLADPRAEPRSLT